MVAYVRLVEDLETVKSSCLDSEPVEVSKLLRLHSYLICQLSRGADDEGVDAPRGGRPFKLRHKILRPRPSVLQGQYSQPVSGRELTLSMAGMRKARVFPVPVLALQRMSTFLAQAGNAAACTVVHMAYSISARALHHTGTRTCVKLAETVHRQSSARLA